MAQIACYSCRVKKELPTDGRICYGKCSLCNNVCLVILDDSNPEE